MSDDDNDLPLAVRARNRRDALAAILAKLPDDRKTERSDLQIAIDTIDGLLTGDTTQLSSSTAMAVNQWLEENKYLS